MLAIFRQFLHTRLRSVVLPVAAGLLLSLAFPGDPERLTAALVSGYWALVALVPLLASLEGGFKTAFGRGWLTGAVFNLCSLYWVAHTQGGGPAVVGGTVLMAAYLGLFSGLFAGGMRQLLRRFGPPALMAAPLLWTALEYLLSLGELGFPWLLLGHALAAYPALIQQATVTGVYGVSFWAVAVNAALFWMLASGRIRPRAVALTLALTAAPALYGSWVLARSPSLPTVRVGLVQNNIGIEKWRPGGRQRSFASLERLSRQAAAQTPDLLVWPETALPCYIAHRPDCRGRVEDLVAATGIPLLTGAPDYDPQTRQPYNAAFFFRPDTPQWQSYAKMHLVPFGERTPYRDRIPLLRDIDWGALTGELSPAEFSPGTRRTVFAHDTAPFAVLICFESVFPDLVRRSVLEGAALLVNITNDSWFGRTAGPYQHAQLAVLRAVENRTSIARCATSGISCFIDPYGRVTAPTGLYVEAAPVAPLPVGGATTFYTRHGDLFAQASTALALASLGAAWRRRA